MPASFPGRRLQSKAQPFTYWALGLAYEPHRALTSVHETNCTWCVVQVLLRAGPPGLKVAQIMDAACTMKLVAPDWAANRQSRTSQISNAMRNATLFEHVGNHKYAIATFPGVHPVPLKPSQGSVVWSKLSSTTPAAQFWAVTKLLIGWCAQHCACCCEFRPVNATGDLCVWLPTLHVQHTALHWTASCTMGMKYQQPLHGASVDTDIKALCSIPLCQLTLDVKPQSLSDTAHLCPAQLCPAAEEMMCALRCDALCREAVWREACTD